MGASLRVSTGTSLDQLQVVPVNYDKTGVIELDSELFQGRIAVRLRDFAGELPKGKDRLPSCESNYFNDHLDLTWSMAIQGRFKSDVNADDLVFGNTFEQPIRDHLPYGTSAALKFMKYVDPSFEQDIYADKPWAFSPLLATMNWIHATKTSEISSSLPAWQHDQPTEDIDVLVPEADRNAPQHPVRGNPGSRRSYLANHERRKAITITPDVVIDADFCNGYLDFNTFSLKLPGGLHFSLLRYWDGQPVTYLCQSKDGSRKYFYIVFEIVDHEAAAAEKGHNRHTEEVKVKGDLSDVD